MIHKATMLDVQGIHDLITPYAEQNLMLFRSYENLYECLRDFSVCRESVDGKDTVIGCVALELAWRDLAEVKSLAVAETHRGQGIGRHLVKAAADEARSLQINRLFTLTREEAFFRKLGFAVVAKATLPHKVWTDCVRCPLQDNCDEIAMIIDLNA